MERKECPIIKLAGAPCHLCAQKERLERMAKVLGWAMTALLVVVVGSLAVHYWPVG